VQTLEVATPGLGGYSKNNIFPNSEIMFVPPHADAGWRAELQINPGEYLVFVGISVAVALLVLAVITAIFKWQERREDEIERRKATHLINFDAL
jgi:integrin alpha FG-GAP repeat containing protein 1